MIGNVQPGCRRYLEASVLLRITTEDGALNEELKSIIIAHSTSECRLRARTDSVQGNFVLFERPSGDFHFAIDGAGVTNGFSGVFGGTVSNDNRKSGAPLASSSASGFVAGDWVAKALER